MVREYEDNIQREFKKCQYYSGGQIVTTITTDQRSSSEVSEPKKNKLMTETIESASSGYAHNVQKKNWFGN